MQAIEHYLTKPWLRHYPPGVPPTVEVPAETVHGLFDAATERLGDRPAVVFYGRTVSYRELREATDRLAAALAAQGVKKGDRVGLYLLNSPQFIIAYFAALKCGATVTPISPVYTSHEVKFQLQDTDRIPAQRASAQLKHAWEIVRATHVGCINKIARFIDDAHEGSSGVLDVFGSRPGRKKLEERRRGRRVLRRECRKHLICGALDHGNPAAQR
jgi:acyl-CoA synthetase (AMP-forming)/AMP-acid ligase II